MKNGEEEKKEAPETGRDGDDQENYMTLGICCGLALGAAIGAAVGSLTVCMVLGMCCGLAIGGYVKKK